jgi:formylglycine-generating enzyme required for sulfatase activity
MTTAPVVPTGPSPKGAGAPGKAGKSGLAAASLVAGVLGLGTAGLASIVGLILGVKALKRIGRGGGALRGRGLAIAGLVVSVGTLLLWALAGAIGVGYHLANQSNMATNVRNYPSLESREKEPAAAPATAAPTSAASTTAAPAELTVDLGGGVTMKLVLIRPGKFMMGDGKDRHEVTLSKPFYMGVTEVTQAQYEAVMGASPSHFKGATNPVEMVYWNDAAEFCKKLSGKTRQTFRLPTEAEWEYACRAGTQTAFSFGDDPSVLGDHAWGGRNSAKTTHPVGQKKPNAWGLYDMHGNIWEWCADWHGDYPKDPVTDPSGPATGRYRVLRGGSWSYVDADCFRCGFRLYYDVAPSLRNFNYGFRCARTL